VPEASLEQEITYLKGIGPTRAKLMAKWGVLTVADLLHHFPHRYEDRRLTRTISQLEIGDKDSFLCEVIAEPQTRMMGHRNLTKVRVGDETGRLDLSWWNQPFREKQLKIGMKLFCYGKINEFGGTLQVDSPEFEIISEEDGSQVGGIVPVYPATEGLYQSNLRRAIADALDKYGPILEEMIPEDLREKWELWPLEKSMREIHFPTDWESKESARYRLVFEELFLLQVALAQKSGPRIWKKRAFATSFPTKKSRSFCMPCPSN
jgi:ATP-dependent DNA helicase RecG